MSDGPKQTKQTQQASATADDDFDEELLEQVADCQTEADELNLKASDEILQVEARYNKLRQPWYEKRCDLVKRIPNFWVTSIMNHPKVCGVLDADEEDCLHSLSKLWVEEADDIKPGFRLNFHFDENPYFENKVLTKEFFLKSMSISTPIEWREGKNLLEQVLQKPYHNNRKRHSVYKSFFDWFSDEADIISDKIALSLRDEIWQNPLRYYLMKDIGEEPEDDEEMRENKTLTSCLS